MLAIFLVVTLEDGFEALVALHTQDGDAAVLERLGHPKPHHPPQPLAVGAHGREWPQVFDPRDDGEKRDDVAWHAHGKHYHSRAKRKLREPVFYFLHQFKVCVVGALVWHSFFVIVCDSQEVMAVIGL